MITNADLLVEYKNGNCAVQLYADGTKVRTWPDGEESQSEFPESIDLKVTDWCDGGCQYCHERSTAKGCHARLEDVKQVCAGLPGGVELAIGGGDALSWPHIEALLGWLRERGIVANITVNARNLERHRNAIRKFRERKLIHGLSVSYSEQHLDLMNEITDENTVWHVIAGIDNVHEILRLRRKILVLGYKRFGRGEAYFDEAVKQNLDAWRYWVGSLMKTKSIISFDNLAIEQLDVQNRITPEAWNRYFLGADGSHTMYIDAVRMEYAKASTASREPIGNMGIREMFAMVKNQAKHGR